MIAWIRVLIWDMGWSCVFRGGHDFGKPELSWSGKGTWEQCQRCGWRRYQVIEQ